MTFCEPKSAGSVVETPPEIFRPLDEEFHFQRDVCALPENAKCQQYWSPADDGLKQEWSGVLWCNPPYGREIADWVLKAYSTAFHGKGTVVCLLPVRSNNEWWKYVIESEVRFLRGKPTFVGHTSVTMFPVCVAIFHAHLDPGGIMKVWRPRNA